MILLTLLELACAAAFLIIVLTQLIVPLATKTKTWPMFRRKSALDKIAEAREILEAARLEKEANDLLVKAQQEAARKQSSQENR